MGSTWSDPQILQWIDRKFLLSDRCDFRLISGRGSFAVERHAEKMQDRGDEDSIIQRQRSVETIGVRQELRSPPWIVQHATLGVDDEFRALHWGTLLDGTRRAWQADAAKQNKVACHASTSMPCQDSLPRLA